MVSPLQNSFPVRNHISPEGIARHIRMLPEYRVARCAIQEREVPPLRGASHGCDGLNPLQFRYCMTLSLSDIWMIVSRPGEGERYITKKPLYACQLTTPVARACRTYWLRICRHAAVARET